MLILWLLSLILCGSIPMLGVSATTNTTHHHHAAIAGHHHNRKGDKLLMLENMIVEKRALQKLTDSLAAYANGTELFGRTVFEDVTVAIEFHPNIIHQTDGKIQQQQKFFIGTNAIKLLGKEYIVYAGGIDNNPVFEAYMASELNASVFAFDCTNEGNKDWTSFTFYPWCIGLNKTFDANKYSQDSGKTEYIFHPLKDIRQKLGHAHIDMLKMDIEGCEWDILYNDIIAGKDEDLPSQIVMELHTEGANKYWVPPNIVKGKGRKEVTQLFLDLCHRNYRVTNIELNKDVHCAEISLFRIAT